MGGTILGFLLTKLNPFQSSCRKQRARVWVRGSRDEGLSLERQTSFLSTSKVGKWPTLPRLVWIVTNLPILVWFRGEWNLCFQTYMEAGKGPELEIPTSRGQLALEPSLGDAVGGVLGAPLAHWQDTMADTGISSTRVKS